MCEDNNACHTCNYTDLGGAKANVVLLGVLNSKHNSVIFFTDAESS